jgi:DNA-binding HxlR family transcriptional regulator
MQEIGGTKKKKTNSQKVIHAPINNALHVIGERWTVLIIRELMEGAQRYGELKKSVTGISLGTLDQRLVSLEHDGIIERAAYAEFPRRVEYTLTPLGRSLEPVITTLEEWGTFFAEATRSEGETSSPPPS